MYNRYPNQTKRNVVAAHRAGISLSSLSKALNIPRSSIHTWDKSKEFKRHFDYLSHSKNVESILPFFDYKKGIKNCAIFVCTYEDGIFSCKEIINHDFSSFM